MSGRKAKAARKALGEDAIKPPKRPTRPYLDRQQREERRRKNLAAARRQERIAASAARLAVDVRREKVAE